MNMDVAYHYLMESSQKMCIDKLKKNKRNVIIVGIVIAIAIVQTALILPFYLETYDPVWEGMTCDQMIDWSGTDAHHSMSDRGHVVFHMYYNDQCGNITDLAVD